MHNSDTASRLVREPEGVLFFGIGLVRAGAGKNTHYEDRLR